MFSNNNGIKFEVNIQEVLTLCKLNFWVIHGSKKKSYMKLENILSWVKMKT